MIAMISMMMRIRGRNRIIRFWSGVVLVLFIAAGSADGQGQRDFSQVQIASTRISDGFYTLDGEGGRIGVLAGPDGVLMVDSQFGPLTEKIVAAVREISTAPIRFLINTHVHGDHTGGNEHFGSMGVTITARAELRERLAQAGQPSEALPKITYDGPVTFHLNGEQVQLIPIRRAHTDGDTLVRFRNADALMTGDYFRSVGYPNIDRNNGGTLEGLVAGLGTTIGLAGPKTKVIPGHGPVTDRAAVMAHLDMVYALRDRVSQLIDEGRTEEQIVAERPAAQYDATIQPPNPENADRFIRQLYAELAPAE